MVKAINKWTLVGVVMAALAAALFWNGLASGSGPGIVAGAEDPDVHKLHGESASASFSIPDGFAFVSVGTNREDGQLVTRISYAVFTFAPPPEPPSPGEPRPPSLASINFGFGIIPNEDFSVDRPGNPAAAALDTHTDRIDGVVEGDTGPIRFDLAQDGLFSFQNSGNSQFDLAGFLEVKSSGHSSFLSARGEASVLGAESGSATGDVGFQRITQTVKFDFPELDPPPPPSE